MANRLAKLNYIFFTDPAAFDTAIVQVAQAIQSDITWIREHSRIGELAHRWAKTGQRKDLLLRGAELQEAAQWARYRPEKAPLLTADTSAFLDASLTAERASQKTTRRVQGTIITLLLGIIGSLVAFINQDYLREQYAWRFVMRPAILQAARERELAVKPGSEFSECGSGCPKMVIVPAGQFLMGSAEAREDSVEDRAEWRQHEVKIAQPFAVSKFEVSFAEWDVCVSAGACPDASDFGWGRGDRPAINVSWDDTQRYISWLSRLTGKQYRLLTEAEWEYAARAGSTGRYSFGDSEADIDRYAWYSRNSAQRTQAVGSKERNKFGLYDMHGNVWEWVADPWHDNYRDAPTDGSAWVVGGHENSKVIRGSSWNFDAGELRTTIRHGTAASGKGSIIGIRLGRTLER